MSELIRRQAEALRYRKALADERKAEHEAGDNAWCECMAVEMLLNVQCMKYEYHAAANVVIMYFCEENGLDFEELELIASNMASDSPGKPQP